MHNAIESIKKIIGLEQLEIVEVLGESVPDMTPVLGSILTNIKIKRLAKRLTLVETELNQIRDFISVETNLDKVEQIKDFVLPIFLQKLLEEDEEQKIKYLARSINKVINAGSLNESHLVIILDILDNLRCIEIDYLISLIDNTSFLDKENMSQNIIKFIETKLEKIGLIEMANSIKFAPSKEYDTLAATYQNETVVTELGNEIVNFIR